MISFVDMERGDEITMTPIKRQFLNPAVRPAAATWLFWREEICGRQAGTLLNEVSLCSLHQPITDCVDLALLEISLPLSCVLSCPHPIPASALGLKACFTIPL